MAWWLFTRFFLLLRRQWHDLADVSAEDIDRPSEGVQPKPVVAVDEDDDGAFERLVRPREGLFHGQVQNREGQSHPAVVATDQP